MTLDKLLKITSAEWDELPDDKLRPLLEPFFKVTRPEFGRIVSTKQGLAAPRKNMTRANASTVNELMEMMKRAGLTPPIVTPTKPTT